VQTLPPLQTVPQVPQFAESVIVSRHVPPQAVFPVGHSHEPLKHEEPPVQALSHRPQLALSLIVSTQLPLHSDCP